MTRLIANLVAALALLAFAAAPVQAQSGRSGNGPDVLSQFATDLSQRAIDLSELRAGGPPKDGIPSIDNPSFVSVGSARAWVEPQEPVIALEHGGEAKAYPLKILTHHEIVNDRIGGTPVAVTFCPLCYSALVFERVLQGEPVEFGVSGMLRKSDMVMYDRRTETLWQQFTGKAIVGDLTGTVLTQIPAQIVAFRQFAEAYPGGEVLSKNTGHGRNYDRNPYAGYDDVDSRPFAYAGEVDDRLPPKEKVVTVSLDGTHVAYPHSVTREKTVVNDAVDGRPIAVVHLPGAVSALDARQVAASKEVGSTGVFDRRVDGRTLTFRPKPSEDTSPEGKSSEGASTRFVDEETGSTWTLTGRAVAGPLKGTQLTRLPHTDSFAFAWFAFRPNTRVYTP
jgi:hypothetical protein